MIGRRLQSLYPEGLGELRTCGAPGRVPRGTQAAWASAAAEQWGLCGVAFVHQDEVLAHALVCPTLHLPPDHPLAQWPRSPESAALLEMHRLDRAPSDVEKLLVQSLAARLHGQVSGIEAAGQSGAGDCHQPAVELLEQLGFTPVPGGRARAGRRMRLDMSSTVVWRPGLRGAWRAVKTLVERPLGPEPTGRG